MLMAAGNQPSDLPEKSPQGTQTRAVTAVSALGRLTSHPGTKTSLRTRLTTHQRQTDRNEHTGAAEQKIQPKDQPRKKPNHVPRLFSPELRRRRLFQSV